MSTSSTSKPAEIPSLNPVVTGDPDGNGAVGDKPADKKGDTGSSSDSDGRGAKEQLGRNPRKGRAMMMAFCSIPNCSKRDLQEQLTPATPTVLTYFGIRDKKNAASIKVCSGCLTKAYAFQNESVDALKGSRCMFTVKHAPQHIPGIADVDKRSDIIATSSTPSNPSSSVTREEEVQIDFDRMEVEGLVKSIFRKFRIKKQIQSCKEKVAEEVMELESDLDDLNKTIESTDNTLYDACKLYNEIFDRTPQPCVVEEVEINANGSTRKRGTGGSRPVGEDANSLPERPATNVADSKEELGQILSKNTTKKTRFLRAAPAVFPRVEPKIGDVVFAMNNSLLNNWLQAEILELIENPDTKQPEFIVQIEPTKNGKSTGGSGNDSSIRIIRQLCLKELAYSCPFPFLLPVGSRVIAKFKDELNSTRSAGHYYAGIVAEPAKHSTEERYLIFFDDGYTQYVQPEEVLVICESSKDVWDDVHPDSYKFIREYIIRYPEWPKVRLVEGSMVSTEWNGKWLVARIIDSDCSLVKVRFENDGREEWIYRGSPRFRPIFRIITNKENGKENKIPHRKIDWMQCQAEAQVVHDNSEVAYNDQRALKSTTGGSFHEQVPSGLRLRGAHVNDLDPDLCIEFQGTVTKVQIPTGALKPKNFMPHDCSSACVIDYVPTREMKGKSPLALPLFLGWTREIGKYPRQSVFYRTPCGLRVRDYTELSTFLQTTSSNLSLDFFSFDYSINCLNQFVPARALLNIKDVSYGREAVPVQCVNSIDHDTLPYMEYTPGQIVGSGVNLSTDNGFLVCCDCIDDCQDKEKCACWRRTMEGISFTKISNPDCPTVGYEHRRLKEHIVSGIYECNVNCKCKKTCTNRVVQNGVTWPLQIFKTARKGWGIRALYDMPEGAFICIYAGEILTDQCATADGMEYGDEYLAALDFIEINEGVKADYESDVTDIEEETNAEGSDSETLPAGKKPRVEELSDQRGVENGTAAPSTSKIRSFATRRTDGQKTNLDHVFSTDEESITARARLPSYFQPKLKEKQKRRPRLRSLYSQEEQCHTMDAKSKGNIGRYLNHSCRPNVFVQNVFVTTHDMRFPMVAFFTNSFVRAGTELTWDYHYQIGSVPEKSMYCFCMTPYCRGRLL